MLIFSAEMHVSEHLLHALHVFTICIWIYSRFGLTSREHKCVFEKVIMLFVCLLVHTEAYSVTPKDWFLCSYIFNVPSLWRVILTSHKTQWNRHWSSCVHTSFSWLDTVQSTKQFQAVTNVQCGRTLCDDAFLKTSHTSRLVLKPIRDSCRIFWAWHYFKLCASS
jgi:hypothetical protein